MTVTALLAAAIRPTPVAPFLLLVDDERDILDMVKRLVQLTCTKHGRFDVAAVQTPEEAVATAEVAAKRGAPLLVLSDFNLGASRDGLELLREVHERYPDAWLALVSGYPRQDFEKRAEFALLTRFIAKPFQVAEVRDLVNEWLVAGGPTR